MEEDYCQQENSFTTRELKDCPECGKPRISFGWCKDCETNSMKENFPYWTSENKEIDELIRHTQLNASQTCDYLEWIPFEKFEMVKHIGIGGFGSVYSAVWMEGPRWNWDDGVQEWTRAGPTFTALKRLDNSQNISSSFISQVNTVCCKYGINLIQKHFKDLIYPCIDSRFLDRSNGILSWTNIIDTIWGIARGLEKIHAEGKVHRNLHGGNLLVDERFFIGTRIADVGLHDSCYYHENKSICGVLPFIAPEILRGEGYSTASDIYSFGIIMNVCSTGKRPWYFRAHDISLAKDICDGKRLEIPDYTPSFYAELMQQCWDDDPEKRPTASYLNEKLGEWIILICDDPNPSKISDENSIAEERRWKMISKMNNILTHPEVHPEAYYTSRPLYFPELSNAKCYYNSREIR